MYAVSVRVGSNGTWKSRKVHGVVVKLCFFVHSLWRCVAVGVWVCAVAVTLAPAAQCLRCLPPVGFVSRCNFLKWAPHYCFRGSTREYVYGHFELLIGPADHPVFNDAVSA